MVYRNGVLVAMVICNYFSSEFSGKLTQPAIICSKFKMETLEQSVKYAQS